MKYAYCNEMFVDEPFDQACTAMRALGYTGVEIAPFSLMAEAATFDVDDVSTERRAEVKQQAADAGLEVVGLHWLLAKTDGIQLTSPHASVRQVTTEYLKRLAQLCHDLGGKIMVLGSPQQRKIPKGTGYNDAEQFAAEVIRTAMPACVDHNVTLALEPLSPADCDFMITAKSAIQLAKLVDSPNCKLHLDVKAMASEAQQPEVVIADCRDWLVHFHANDPNLLGPGMGKVEYGPIMQALVDVNYHGWISVEVFDYSPGPVEIGEKSIEYLRKIEAAIANAPTS